MSTGSKSVEFKSILSKGVEALAEIEKKSKIRLKKDEDKPKLTRILAILMNSFGAKKIDDKVSEYIKGALKLELAVGGTEECPQVGGRSVCYNANHVLATAFSIAYLRVKEQS